MPVVVRREVSPAKHAGDVILTELLQQLGGDRDPKTRGQGVSTGVGLSVDIPRTPLPSLLLFFLISFY